MDNNHFHIGITGTREGMTEEQRAQFSNEVMSIRIWRFEGKRIDLTYHHGCCVGVDAQAHDKIQADNLFGDIFGRIFNPRKIIVHPPTNKKYAAEIVVCDNTTVLESKTYNARNKDIVDASDIIVAMPKSMLDRTGGTWNTIRMARKSRVPVYIIEPDGRFTFIAEKDWYRPKRDDVSDERYAELWSEVICLIEEENPTEYALVFFLALLCCLDKAQ